MMNSLSALPPRSHTLKLAVFDLDGTLKSVRSPYDFVHRALGMKAQAAQIV